MSDDNNFQSVIFYYTPITVENGRIKLELNRARLTGISDPIPGFPQRAEYTLPNREKVDLHEALALRDHGLFYEYLLENRGRTFTGAELMELASPCGISVFTVMTFINSFVPQGVSNMPSAMAPFAVGFSDNNVLLEFKSF